MFVAFLVADDRVRDAVMLDWKLRSHRCEKDGRIGDA